MTQPSVPTLDPAKLPLRGEYDVVVLGAGPGGFAAAVASARLGARTLIVERAGYPGGMATGGCCPNLMGFAVDGRQVVRGIGDELVRLLDRQGAARLRAPGAVCEREPIGDRPLLSYVLIDPQAARVAINRMLDDAGAHRLYYTSLVAPVRQGRSITAAVIDNVEGPALVRARAFIDATGDAQLAWRAGASVQEGTPEQTMTKTILCTVAGVKGFDNEAINARFRALHAAGDTPFPHQDRCMGMELLHPGHVSLNLTLIAGDARSADDLTRMDGELREQVLRGVAWYREKFPEFAECYLVDAAAWVGVRASRAILGRQTITVESIEKGIETDEPVTYGQRYCGDHYLTQFCAPWMRHGKAPLAVPFDAIKPADLANVLAAGRAISVQPQAVTSIRLMATCMATGQAAGTAAALASRDGIAPVDVPYAALRESLLAQNAIV